MAPLFIFQFMFNPLNREVEYLRIQKTFVLPRKTICRTLSLCPVVIRRSQMRSLERDGVIVFLWTDGDIVRGIRTSEENG